MLDLSPWLQCHIGESSIPQGNAKGDSTSSIVHDAKRKEPGNSKLAKLHIHFARTRAQYKTSNLSTSKPLKCLLRIAPPSVTAT